MNKYLAMQIIKGKLTYEQCANKFPKRKEEIDLILIEEGREDLITEVI